MIFSLNKILLTDDTQQPQRVHTAFLSIMQGMKKLNNTHKLYGDIVKVFVL